MITAAAGFLAAIIADPADDTPRLVYADWLEEHGETARAEFVRVQCALDEDDGDTLVGECGQCWARRGGMPHTNGPCRCSGRRKALRRREWELLPSGGFPPLLPCGPVLSCWADAGHQPGEGWGAVSVWRRGFIESITLPCADWLAHGPAVVRAQPVTRVKLTDKRPRYVGQQAGNGRYNDRWGWFHPDVPGMPPGLQDVAPRELFALLKGGPGSVPRCKWYDSEAEAYADLSAAALAWARGS